MKRVFFKPDGAVIATHEVNSDVGPEAYAAFGDVGMLILPDEAVAGPAEFSSGPTGEDSATREAPEVRQIYLPENWRETYGAQAVEAERARRAALAQAAINAEQGTIMLAMLENPNPDDWPELERAAYDRAQAARAELKSLAEKAAKLAGDPSNIPADLVSDAHWR